MIAFVDVTSTLVDGILSHLYLLTMDGVMLIFSVAAEAWLKVPISVDAASITSNQRDLDSLVMVLMAASVIVGGARMAWERRAEQGQRLLRSLLVSTLAVGGSATIVVTAVAASDALALHLCPGDKFTELAEAFKTLADSASKTSGLKVLMLSVAGLACVTSVVQVIVLLLRSAGLTVLTVVIPLAAAFTNLELGQSWFRKTCTWIIALVLYKPAAALLLRIGVDVLTASVTNAGAGTDSAGDVRALLVGVTTMVMAVFALPVLVKLITPAVGVAASGGLSLSGQPSGGSPTGAAPSPPSGSRAGQSPPPTAVAASGGPAGSHATAPKPATGTATAAGSTTTSTGTAATGGTLLAAQAAVSAGVWAAQTADGLVQSAARTATGDGPDGSSG